MRSLFYKLLHLHETFLVENIEPKIKRNHRAITHSHVTIICSTVGFSAVFLYLECDSCSNLPSVLVPHAATASVPKVEGKMATLLLCRKLECFCVSRNEV